MHADMKESNGRRIIKPLPPEALYLLDGEWTQRIAENRWRSIGAFEHPDGENLLGRAGRSFAAERKQKEVNLFDAVVTHMAEEQAAGRFSWSPPAAGQWSDWKHF